MQQGQLDKSKLNKSDRQKNNIMKQYDKSLIIFRILR